MVKIQKQYVDNNHVINLQTYVATEEVAADYLALVTLFCSKVKDKIGHTATVKCPKILPPTDIAIHVVSHFNYFEVVLNEILTLDDTFELKEFGIFMNKKPGGNIYSCISFKLKQGNGYFVQVSRFIGKLTDPGKGNFEAKIKVGNNWPAIKSPTLVGLFDEIYNISNQNKSPKPQVDQTDFVESHVEEHFELIEQPSIMVQQ